MSNGLWGTCDLWHSKLKRNQTKINVHPLVSDRCGFVFGAVDGRGAPLTAKDEEEEDAVEERDHEEYDESAQSPRSAGVGPVEHGVDVVRGEVSVVDASRRVVDDREEQVQQRV